MVRVALAATAAGVATLGAGWAALGASEPAPRRPRPRPLVAPAAPRSASADLPPLPDASRAKVVEPVAGTVTACPTKRPPPTRA